MATEQYWRMTEDKVWLADEGFTLADGIAQFWVSRVSWNSTYGQYVINGVVGPDEYATGVNYTGILCLYLY